MIQTCLPAPSRWSWIQFVSSYSHVLTWFYCIQKSITSSYSHTTTLLVLLVPSHSAISSLLVLHLTDAPQVYPSAILTRSCQLPMVIAWIPVSQSSVPYCQIGSRFPLGTLSQISRPWGCPRQHMEAGGQIPPRPYSSSLLSIKVRL